MATQVPEQMGAKEAIAFGRGRQSLEQSVWYSGWLLTFLATGQDTQGQFSLMEQVATHLRAVEPSNPAPYLLDRARALAARDFLSLLGEVFSAEELETMKNGG